jgi:Transglycosylase SLT domain
MLVALPLIHAYPGMDGLGQSAPQVQQMIVSAAGAYPNVPGLADVALAVASHESAFQPAAQNPGSSAAGVFQLVSVTQSTMGVSNPLDAQQNVDAGVALLAQYYQQYGNWNTALQAFSDGPGTVASGTAPSPQTLGLISYVNSYSPSVALDASGSGGLDLSTLTGSDDSNPVSEALGLSDYGVTDNGLLIGAACLVGFVWLMRA